MTMSPVDWQRVESIYHAALLRPAADRAAFVAEASAGDAAVAREVTSLLESGDAAGSLFATGGAWPRTTLIGQRLGVYQVVSLLGAGGMGEVYRARDTKLDRDVAIKVLPPAFASDPDRLVRFSREAKTLAALNHPNIAAIYGIEGNALVMELVEGQDLSAMIGAFENQGALRTTRIPLPAALAIAKQIADALEAAHDLGIVHRDLKPANIKVRADGTVKVLDFGLAKALAPNSASAADVLNSPTITTPAMTEQGLILGTAAYMSPEQAAGKAADKRSDLWSFGVVLFEMLTGRRLFAGETVSHVLAEVLKSEPDWTTLPAETPTAVRRLLRRCLEKDRRRRIADASDVRLDLEEAASPNRDGDAATTASAVAIVPKWRRALPWAIVAGLATALVAVSLAFLSVRPQSDADITRSLISVTPADSLRAVPMDQTLADGRPSRTAFALSPDGRSLVFSAVSGSRQQLFVRRLDQLEATAIDGTDDGHSPFFSPDGKWIGFQAGGFLRKVLIAGGAPPTTVCEVRPLFGATWGLGDTIVYAIAAGGLWRVPAGGGVPEALTTVDPKQAEHSHRLPHFLPDGEGLIFTITSSALPKWGEARLSHLALSTGERRDLGPGADARYVSSGHLVFTRSGTLVAAPFNASTRDISANSITMLSDLMQAANMTSDSLDTGAGQFSISLSGSLVYMPGGIFPDREVTIVSVDRQGRARALPNLPPRPYFAPLLSPDGTRLVVWTQGQDRNVWTYDLARGTLTRLTTEGRNHRGIWAPDGKRVAYASAVDGAYNLFSMAADGSGVSERLTTSLKTQTPSSWSPDSRTLVFLEQRGPGKNDVMALSLDGGDPRPILQSQFLLSYPEVSPDGRWLAYVSNESTRSEVYVQPYPGPGPRQRISTEGGIAPAWSRRGEIFYTMQPTPGVTRLMAVPFTVTPSFVAGIPRMLFEERFAIQALTRGYDVSLDGQTFYLTQAKERPPVHATQMILVRNWVEELKMRVAKK